MKKFSSLCLFLLVSVLVYAQHNTREEIYADIERAGGVHYLYPTDQPRPTAAPKGYKAFYVSHLGRHGARYALGNSVYEDILDVWTRAAQNDWLTPEGKLFYADYCALYPAIGWREGILTGKGQEQLRFIARQLYRNYPSVFKGETRAEAVSTVSHRVIVSMFSFLSELERLDRDFAFEADYSYPYQAYLLPDIIDSQEERGGEAAAKFEAFCASSMDLDAVLARWFTRPASLVENPYSFCAKMHTMLSTLDNLDVAVPERLYSLFTAQERYALWRAGNYRDYQLMGRFPGTQNKRALAMRALARDFVQKAEADWKEGISLRLRFAHDSSLMPLLSLLDVNGMGVRIEDPYEVENYWRSFDIPMACNLQLIFFKSKKNPEILVQLLLNGKEATLPLEMAAPGSFYRWEDVKLLLQ